MPRARGDRGPYRERVTELLAVLEEYYDAAPRPHAHTEEVGPFTLFLRDDPAWWAYYGRPRLGLAEEVTPADVRRLIARQDEVGAPRTIEWVHETTPSLLAAAREAGVEVEVYALLVLDEPALLEPPEGIALEPWRPTPTTSGRSRPRSTPRSPAPTTRPRVTGRGRRTASSGASPASSARSRSTTTGSARPWAAARTARAAV